MEQEAKKAADNFINNETQFHLGFLETESPHQKTTTFSETIQRDTKEGIQQFLSVDYDLVSKAGKVFNSEEYRMLVSSIYQSVENGRKIGFSGCGSTGRLSIILESFWRKFWNDTANKFPGQKSHFNEIAERSFSIMTGSDRALIKSVENFEDFISFGRQQSFDAGILEGDLLIAVSEGGETSSVIGTARGALERGATLFFVYNNKKEVLREKIIRSRDLIDDPRVISLDLSTGPMALAGSTRLQATTMEMLVLGAAMEQAALKFLTNSIGEDKVKEAGYRPVNPVEYDEEFRKMVDSLSCGRNLDSLARLVDEESEIYRKGGRVTYFADTYLLDIFADTTERSPTFSIPPFRKLEDRTSPVSWAFAKDLFHDTRASWKNMLKREPRPICWECDDYKRMGASGSIVENPPDLSLEEIYSYPIGSEDDPSRYETDPNIASLFTVADGQNDGLLKKSLDSFRSVSRNFSRNRIIMLKTEGEGPAEKAGNDIQITLSIPATPMCLFQHLAVKLIFNTFSTASMACLGRIRGNWMIQVSATNKKLIDRATRIISSLAGISYQEACYELHLTLVKQRAGESEGVSCVVVTLDRLARENNSPPK